MSRRHPSGPSPRVTGRTIQVAVRLPHALHDALIQEGPVSPQIVAAVAREVAARDAARQALAAAQQDSD